MKHSTSHWHATVLVVVGLVLAVPSAAGTIVGSRHDLSTGTTNEVCKFCHTPHTANATVAAPLWNRAVIDKTYTMYASSTLDVAVPGVPNSSSLVCLACHDGVLAYGTYNGNAIGDKHDLVVGPGGEIPDTSSYPNCERCHPDLYGTGTTEWFGTDLSNDHPISVPYPSVSDDPDFQAPPDPTLGWWSPGVQDVRLYGGQIECGSCHEPHDPTNGHFLRKSNDHSELCTTCHAK
jgi:predicted CXXCH cytochrome family protein